MTERGHRREKCSHAQAPSVPIRRAGRRASDEEPALPYALRGEKSVIGGTCNPSVAPHLHRWLVREVRSEFSWTVARASGRSNRRFAHFFFGTFFLLIALGNEWVTEKSALSPCKGRLCAEGAVVRKWSARALLHRLTAEPPNFLHAKCFSRWHNVRREPMRSLRSLRREQAPLRWENKKHSRSRNHGSEKER